jgi:hypothetical protein
MLGTFNFKRRMMKILIGCAGIGGESELWDDTANNITHV